jgi:hypothetical protein
MLTRWLFTFVLLLVPASLAAQESYLIALRVRPRHFALQTVALAAGSWAEV